MESAESGRSRSKRDHEDGSRIGEEEEDWDVGSDRRKHRSSKSRKHGNVEEVEEQRDVGGRKGSGERSDGRRKFGSSNRGDSGEEDEYDARRELRSKIPKKNPDDRGGADRRSGADGYRDVEPDSGSRKGRNDENERNSSKKASVKSSVQEGDSQSRSRSRAERGSYDVEYEKVQEKDSRYAERKDGSREKSHGSREQERSSSRRRWDEVDPGRKADESGYGERSESRSAKVSDHNKQGLPRDRSDNRNEPAESKSKYIDSSAERSVRSGGREEKRVDVERSKSRARPDSLDEDSRLIPAARESRQESFRDDKQRRDSERPLEDAENSFHKGSSRIHLEKADKHKQQREPAHASRDDADIRERATKMDEDGHSRMRDRSAREVRPSRRSRTPERRHHRDPDELDRGYSESDNERVSTLKGKERERDSYRDDRSSKGKDSGWSDRSREREASKEHWKRSLPSRQDRDHRDGDMEFEYDKEWDSKKREHDWVESEKLHGRSVYRKDNRTRADMRSTSSFVNANDHSDTIEIRPNKNLDFAREEPAQSYQGRRTDGGLPQETPSGANDEEWRYQADDRGRATYDYGDDFQERFPDDGSPMEQNFRRNSLDSHGGKARGQKPLINSSSGAGQISSNGSQPSYGINQGSGSHNRAIQQGPKGGGRHTRGGRGRPTGRDGQRVAMPLPMMGPPFGHLALPPGPMPPMGPNMPPSPGPPIGPNVFVPPFPGPVIWPGARGVDMNMLAVPPSLSPMPPGPVGPRFPPNMATGPNHGMYFNQSGPGRGVTPNIPGSGFNSMGAVGRGVPHDKPPTGWAPPRSSGPAGKAPSRGEQNDYSQNFVDTGMRPQNFIRELELTSTVEDYPKLRELIQRKDEIVANSATAPMYHKCDLREHILTPEFFGTKFDVILVDPPWEEYVHRAPGVADHMEYWTFEEILNLKIEAIADTPSFIFLWVGDGLGLEQGRQCLKKWGFRRCEDICWVKTNKSNATPSLRHDSHTLFQHSKEHCLMGIKGTVRRSTDGHIIHANIDTDIIIAEEPPYGSTKKPEDIYRIIEHFSLGRRRLELFGEDHNIRTGWLTVGKDLSSSNFKCEEYCRNFADKDGKVWQGGGGRNPPPDAPHLVLTTPDIESLRPKSPPQKNQQQQQSTSISTTANSSKRHAANSPPNPTAASMLNVNQEVSSSNPPTPLPWSSSPVGNYKVIEPGSAGSDDKFFDGYAFNPPRGQMTGDLHDFDLHRAANLL